MGEKTPDTQPWTCRDSSYTMTWRHRWSEMHSLRVGCPRRWQRPSSASILKEEHTQTASVISYPKNLTSRKQELSEHGLGKQRLGKQGPRRKEGLQDDYRKHPDTNLQMSAWFCFDFVWLFFFFSFFFCHVVCNTHCHCPQTHCVADFSLYILSAVITGVHCCVRFQRFKGS